ncbi:uncharacterized protein PAC_16559 [Phialocephala subalpina]|uniref:Condensation domain-containing protein n=1 Tax=Phialocephala subalpina TaxID=576137 RepID=A0A1L7XNQ4_9HELO|nr:uncharacterized protein PAC_16559 [Phialocephala subalpina]
MGEGHALACKFQSCLVVQPESAWTPRELFKEFVYGGNLADGFSEYALAMVCSLHETSVDLDIRFDNAVLGKEEVEQMMQQLGKVLRQISENKNQIIADILTHP